MKFSNFDKIPVEFILQYITEYQKQHIKEQYYLYQQLKLKKNAKKSINKLSEEYSSILNYSQTNVRMKITKIKTTINAEKL